MKPVDLISSMFGMKVIEHPWLGYDTVPNTYRLYPKSWMKGRCYHRRVTKKWGKRYGFRDDPQCLTTGTTMYVPVGECEKLKQALMRSIT